MKAALINELTNEVVNMIELEADGKWQAPQNHFIRFCDNAQIGDYFVDGRFLTFEEYNAL